MVNIKPVSGFNTIRVRDDFETIQEAVDNANAGDRIEVDPGTYPEHVYINKSITLVGNETNPTATVIDGTSNGTVLTLDASSMYISGFTICNAGTSHNGIVSERDPPGTNDQHTIINNIVTTSQYGVCLVYSKKNTLTNNTFLDNFLNGIYLNSANNNDIIENTVSGSPNGIKLQYSTGNTITDNTVSQTSYGIYLSDSSTGNDVTQNTVSGQTAGIYISSDSNTVDHNTVTQCAYGIYLYNCEGETIYYNTCRNNSYGIRVFMLTLTTTGHSITNNKAIYNDWAGIELIRSRDNTLMGNWLQQNTYGVSMSDSPFNTLYRNDFVQNIIQAYTNALNYWNMSGEGNYWSDYTGEDTNPHDGIGDTPYPIIPGYDYCPLMDTWSEHDISIYSVTLSTDVTDPGAIVDITVKVKNQANTSVSETFNVTAKYGLNIIETKPVNDLAQDSNTTLTFNWNTAGVTPANYTISVEASVVPDELNTDNNNFVDGTVYIIFPGDINDDGAVNMDDLILLNHAYGSTPTSGNWNQDADLNKDDLIDALDLFILTRDYGKTA